MYVVGFKANLHHNSTLILSRPPPPQLKRRYEPLDWSKSTRLGSSMIFEFQSSDVSRAMVFMLELQARISYSTLYTYSNLNYPYEASPDFIHTRQRMHNDHLFFSFC